MALAVINTLIEVEDGFQLAAIILKDVFPPGSYWDIIHYLCDLQEEVRTTIYQADDIIEKVKVPNIQIASDLNTIYTCHCRISNPNNDTMLGSKKINKNASMTLRV